MAKTAVKKKVNDAKIDKRGLTTSQEYHESLVGQKVAILCARYTYWGYLSMVLDRALVLSDAVCVEQSGAANADRPEIVDPIGSDVEIMTDAIELVFQPNWSQGLLPSEGGQFQNRR